MELSQPMTGVEYSLGRRQHALSNKFHGSYRTQVRHQQGWSSEETEGRLFKCRTGHFQVKLYLIPAQSLTGCAPLGIVLGSSVPLFSRYAMT